MSLYLELASARAASITGTEYVIDGGTNGALNQHRPRIAQLVQLPGRTSHERARLVEFQARTACQEL
jgi:hypothetical protein